MHLVDKFLVLACVIVYTSAAALSDDLYQGTLIDDDDGINPDDVLEDPGVEVARPRRFSCDLFSFQSQWATPNHSVCAARCIATGKKGGTCRDGVCHCRGRWFGK